MGGGDRHRRSLVALFVYGAATNEAYGWDTFGKYLFDERIVRGVWITLQLTVLAMALGVVLGVVLAVMRLSPNPVFVGGLGLPVDLPRHAGVRAVGVLGPVPVALPEHRSSASRSGHRCHTSTSRIVDAAFFFALLGLGLNEAAYMAEIIRAGIMSVAEGQSEASTALGMSWSLTMRRIVLPQAMRVIIPPTGNEVISMLKTTSLVTAVPLTIDLYYAAREISGVNFQPIPLLLVAATWYLAITSVLMVGQYYLERYFSRGVDPGS